MSKSRVKPTFGREMDPCEYTAKWANQLSKDEVVVIKAENSRVKQASREDGR